MLGPHSGFDDDGMTVTAYLGLRAGPVLDRAAQCNAAAFVIVRLADEITAFNAALRQEIAKHDRVRRKFVSLPSGAFPFRRLLFITSRAGP